MFMFSSGGIVDRILGPLAPNPAWVGEHDLGPMPSIAFYVTWKQMGFFILLFLAALPERPGGVERGGGHRRREPLAVVSHGHHPGSASSNDPGRSARHHHGANLFTEPYLMTSGGGPNGATTTPRLPALPEGHRASTPDVASAIGVLLVIGVLIIAYASRKVTERRMNTPDTERMPRWRRALTMTLLMLGALVFLFPFYYMVVGALQARRNPTLSGRHPPGRRT